MIMNLYSPLSAESVRVEDPKSPDDAPMRPSPMIILKETAPILSPFMCQEDEARPNGQNITITVKTNTETDETRKNGD